jgi:hypothetical protein
MINLEKKKLKQKSTVEYMNRAEQRGAQQKNKERKKS